MTITDTVRDLTARLMDVDIEQIAESTRFDELGRTSFQEVELLLAMEDLFKIELDFQQFCSLATVGELVDLVTATRSTGSNTAKTAEAR